MEKEAFQEQGVAPMEHAEEEEELELLMVGHRVLGGLEAHL